MEAFQIRDHHGAGFEAKPTTGGEVGEGLVDRLARSAHELGKFFLREVVIDVYAVIGAAAEAAREIKQGLRDTAGDVGEHEVTDHFVGAAQTSSQLVQDRAGDIGV